MERKEINFTLQEAGCLIYAADKHLAGFPWRELTNFFGGREGLRELTLKGAIMAGSLYQDDGYNVRVIFGDLTEEEQREWTTRMAWKLNLESGKMVVSGVADEDMEDYMEDFPIAENGGEYELGCFVEIPAGEYAATIYSYPPNDLSGGWMAIKDAREFKLCFSAESTFPFEKPLDFFARTRPQETPPDWLKNGWEDADFLDFVIHLAPLSDELKMPEFELDGCISWEFRKPEICPIGIRI